MDPNTNLKEMDEKVFFGVQLDTEIPGGIIFFANSKIFRFRAFLYKAAGSLNRTTRKGTGYCFVVHRF